MHLWLYIIQRFRLEKHISPYVCWSEKILALIKSSNSSPTPPPQKSQTVCPQCHFFLSCDVLYCCVVLRLVRFCRVVSCRVVLRCAVLCCAALCCLVLCCVCGLVLFLDMSCLVVSCRVLLGCVVMSMLYC